MEKEFNLYKRHQNNSQHVKGINGHLPSTSGHIYQQRLPKLSQALKSLRIGSFLPQEWRSKVG